ncbi:hypothetical protein VNO77_23272 [Canavalia gladiata]|uniref:Uncharacterized protein n=1 Tax=Canavalia gladiata TaxID=3824 RepID=A0AAN9L5K3_CANGL
MDSSPLSRKGEIEGVFSLTGGLVFAERRLWYFTLVHQSVPHALRRNKFPWSLVWKLVMHVLVYFYDARWIQSQLKLQRKLKKLILSSQEQVLPSLIYSWYSLNLEERQRLLDYSLLKALVMAICLMNVRIWYPVSNCWWCDWSMGSARRNSFEARRCINVLKAAQGSFGQVYYAYKFQTSPICFFSSMQVCSLKFTLKLMVQS